MKKIIATVLAMVMALALCTVAFAATTTTTASSSTTLTVKDYKVQTMKGVAVDMSQAESLTYNTEAVKTETKDNGTTTKTVTPAYYTVTTEAGNKWYAVVVDESIATHKVIKGGEVVDFVYANANVTFNADLLSTLTTSKVVTETLKAVAKDDAECGDYYVENGKGGEALYVIGGVKYVAADSDNGITSVEFALKNDKLVAYTNTEATLVGHDFTDQKTNVEKGTITSAYCKNCGEYIPVVTTVPSTSVDEYAAAKGLSGYYYKVGSAAVADNTTDDATTTSPKTFDAGIAMYVGMALTSVAGSAVVIGKKKEF